ncbi:hypothetical protein BGZ63DRAFT_77212 [Mariannaea sp. PMI_226]|nr:hypothetical protein BGZ63DRAFT_77212 [Mariannaea sp. PMI_226]
MGNHVKVVDDALTRRSGKDQERQREYAWRRILHLNASVNSRRDGGGTLSYRHRPTVLLLAQVGSAEIMTTARQILKRAGDNIPEAPDRKSEKEQGCVRCAITGPPLALVPNIRDTGSPCQTQKPSRPAEEARGSVDRACLQKLIQVLRYADSKIESGQSLAGKAGINDLNQA